MTASDHLNPKQMQLFTPEQEPGAFAPPRPGQQSYDEWHSRPDVWYHGTTRPGWANRHDGYSDDDLWDEDNPGPPLTDHYGPFGMAVRHSENRKRMGQEGEPAVYSRRLPPSNGQELSDMHANSVESIYHIQEGMPELVTQSVHGSSYDVAKQMRWAALDDVSPDLSSLDMDRAMDLTQTSRQTLGMGLSLKYANNGEPAWIYPEAPDAHLPERYGSYGSGSPTVQRLPLSQVARADTTASWEEDVLGDSGASPMAQEFARQRVGKPHFTGGASDLPSQRASRRQGVQQRLFTPTDYYRRKQEAAPPEKTFTGKIGKPEALS